MTEDNFDDQLDEEMRILNEKWRKDNPHRERSNYLQATEGELSASTLGALIQYSIWIESDVQDCAHGCLTGTHSESELMKLIEFGEQVLRFRDIKDLA